MIDTGFDDKLILSQKSGCSMKDTPLHSPHFFLSTTLHRDNPSMPVHRPETLELHTANIADPQNSTSSINQSSPPPYPCPDLNKRQYRAPASRKPPHNVQPLRPNIIALNDKQEHKHNLFYFPVKKKKSFRHCISNHHARSLQTDLQPQLQAPRMMMMMMMLMMNMMNKTLAKQILCGARS